MSAATLQLVQSTADVLSRAEKSAWPLVIRALGTNMPSEIFVYQAVPVSDSVPGDRFQCVASVNQLRELPTLAALKLAKHERERRHEHVPVKDFNIFEIPFYRSAEADFSCRSEKESLHIWNLIQADAQRLVDNFNQWQNLQVENTVNLSSDASS